MAWTDILLIILLVAFAFYLFRRHHQKNIEVKYKHKLYKLRDDLRYLVALRKVKNHAWGFDYLDLSIC